MTDLVYWLVSLLAIAGLALVGARAVKLVKTDRRFAGLMFATTMVFGAKTVQPPPRHEFEDEDTKGQKQGDKPKAGFD